MGNIFKLYFFSILYLLEKDVKDIYHVDDTYWSYKASETIVKSEKFKKIFN